MPVGGYKRRTISYSRAHWLNPPKVSLEEALRRCLKSCRYVGDTRIPLRGMEAEIRHRQLKRRGTVGLHIAAWTKGESASIVPHGANGSAADLDESAPDDTWDFLDGDGMVLVSGDHCLLMPSGLHPKALELYLRNLLQHGRKLRGRAIPKDIESFELLAVADADVAKQINREGVKKIDLNVSQYLETSRELERHRHTALQRMGRAIVETLIADEERRQQIEEADNVKARLVISCDTRRAGLRPDDLALVATDLVAEDEDCLEIYTGTGKRIRRGQLVLKKPVEIAAFAKTVDHKEAWTEMERYLYELRDGGNLEE